MSLVKNSTKVILGVFISNLLAYAFHFIAGRMLGPAEYGVFGALMAIFLQIALPAASLGWAIAKFTSRFFTDGKMNHIDFLRRKIQKDILIFSICMLGIVFIFSKSIAYYLNVNSTTPIMIIGFTLGFSLLLPVNRGVLLGLKKFGILSWNNIIEAFSRLLLLSGLLWLGYGVNGAILAYGLAYLIAFLFVFPSIKEARAFNGEVDKINFGGLYKFIFIVLLVNLFMQSLLNIPSLFIKHFYSDEFTGYWTAALNVARISLFITSAISLVVFPEIAGEKDNRKRKKIFARTAMLVLLSSAVIALVFLIVPELFIYGLYGKAFAGAIPILRWMGVAMMFIGFLQLCADYTLARMR